MQIREGHLAPLEFACLCIVSSETRGMNRKYTPTSFFLDFHETLADILNVASSFPLANQCSRVISQIVNVKDYHSRNLEQ